MKLLFVITATFLFSTFAQAMTYNSATKMGRKPAAAAKTQDDDLLCLKQAQDYAHTVYAAILGGRDKIKDVTWLTGGHPLLGDHHGQDMNKWHYEIAVTSTSFVSHDKFDTYDNDFTITLNKKCVPTTMRFYDTRSKEWLDGANENSIEME